MNALVRFTLVATPLAGLLFLGQAGFSDAWSGKAISYKPSRAAEPAVLPVLLLGDDPEGTIVTWPAEVVRDLARPMEALQIPPRTAPEDAATAAKNRFDLHFTVTKADGESEVVPTTSARGLSMAVLAWVLALALHNMYLSGSPFSWEYRPPQPGEPGPGGSGSDGSSSGAGNGRSRASRSRKGPPPPKRRRGKGRR